MNKKIFGQKTQKNEQNKNTCFFKNMLLNKFFDLESLPSDSSVVVERFSRVNLDEAIKEEKKTLYTKTIQTFSKLSSIPKKIINYPVFKPVRQTIK